MKFGGRSSGSCDRMLVRTDEKLRCFFHQVLSKLDSASEKQVEPLTFRPSYIITHG